MDSNTPLTIKDLDKFWNEKLEFIKKMVECVVNEKVDIEIKKTQRRQANAIASKRLPIHNFGQENYDHIVRDLASYFKGTTEHASVLQRVIKDLFFNPEVKRNHNIYIPKESYNYTCIFKDNMWSTYPLPWSLEAVVKRGNDVLQHYLVGSDMEKEFAQSIGKRKYESLKDFTNKIDNIEQYPELLEKLCKDTENTITMFQHICHPQIFEPADN